MILKRVGEIFQRFSRTPVDPIKRRRVELSKQLYSRFGGLVAYGPFKGLKLASQVYWGSAVHSHQLLGIYEQELLYSFLDVPKTHRTFIEIGSQDGYYAVGALLADLFDHAHCFEILKEGQQLIAENAIQNCVRDRVSIYGKADRSLPEVLKTQGVHLDKSVFLCDIEGGEFEMFDASMFERLRGSIIFIELHPFAVTRGDERVHELKIAASTQFNITELTTSARDLSVFTELDSLSDTDRWLLCSEGRPVRMTWLRLDPVSPRTVWKSVAEAAR